MRLEIGAWPDVGVILRSVLVYGVIVSALLAAYLLVFEGVVEHRWREWLVEGWGTLLLGYCIIAFVLSAALWHVPKVQPTWQTWTFAIGVAVVAVGLFQVALHGVARRIRRR